MTTGSDLVRMALRMKNKRINLSSMARDLSMQTSTLEDYAESRTKTMPPDTLDKVVAYLWPNSGVRLDLERDLLVAVDKPAKKFGKVPQPIKGSGKRYEIGSSFVRSTPMVPSCRKREGWRDGFF